MEFITRLGEMVTMDDGSSYQVFQQIEFNSKPYVLLREVPKTEEEKLDFEKYKFRYAEEVLQNDDLYLIPVNDKNLISKLNDIK